MSLGKNKKRIKKKELQDTFKLLATNRIIGDINIPYDGLC